MSAGVGQADLFTAPAAPSQDHAKSLSVALVALAKKDARNSPSTTKSINHRLTQIVSGQVVCDFSNLCSSVFICGSLSSRRAWLYWAGSRSTRNSWPVLGPGDVLPTPGTGGRYEGLSQSRSRGAEHATGIPTLLAEHHHILTRLDEVVVR
jgi:hypothetical protein